MYHLAVLIANPGTEVPAVELVAGLDAVAPQPPRRSMSRQSVLDATAVRRYRQRLAELDGDGIEREWLLAELALNTGPGGRYRTFADDAERARLAAGRAIRRAMGNVERADPPIGVHLRATVHTGIRCWYRPL
jgi:hypothetical protein